MPTFERPTFLRMQAFAQRGWDFAKGFAKENKGATAVMFSVLTSVLMGSIAFGVDGATWYQTDRKLQTGADMAAMAAAADVALQAAAGYQGDTAEAVAEATLTRSGIDVATVTVIEVNRPPSTGAYAGNSNAVEVILSQDVPIFFAGLFVEGVPQAQARAVALSGADGEVCVLALSPTLPAAVLFSGNSNVELDCGIGTNSNDDEAILGQGSADVLATIVRASGGIEDRIAMDASLAPYANPITNPFENVTVPSFSGCDSYGVSKKHTSVAKAAGGNGNGNSGGNGGGNSGGGNSGGGNSTPSTLTPGVYCGDISLGSQSVTTFDDGVYILDDADMTINAQAEVFGENVTFIFTNSSDPDSPGALQINGSADVDLRAPTSGPLTDILFMRDPNASDVSDRNNERWIINGSAYTFMDGAIYVPGVELEITGNGDPSGGCFVIVAGVVTFSGNADVNMTCATAGQELAGIITTRLVE